MTPLRREATLADTDTHDHLEALTSGFTDARAYLCGPAGLVDFAELSLVKRGWPRRSIRADRFLPAF